MGFVKFLSFHWQFYLFILYIKQPFPVTFQKYPGVMFKLFTFEACLKYVPNDFGSEQSWPCSFSRN